jgi:rod shape-determining protein MreC
VTAQGDRSPDYLRGLRRIVLVIVALVLVAIFLIWRIDNARVEQLRMALVDRFVPGFEWALQPVAASARLIADFRSYARVYEQNAELRRELQRMQGWREAALQLEQKNAQLLALNNVRLSPRLTFVTGEVLADSGSPFRQSVMVNTGTDDGVEDGAAVVDGLGLVGRIAGVGERAARVLMITDGSSRLPVVVRPLGQRGLIVGDNRAAPLLQFLEQSDEIRPGDRVVTSADGGILPADILVGQVMLDPEGRARVRPAADLRRLDFVRVIRIPPSVPVEGPGEMIGPRLAAQPVPEAEE